MSALSTSIQRGHAPRRFHSGVFALVLVAAALFTVKELHEYSSPAGGVQGSGVAAAQRRIVAAFTAVDLVGPNIVNVVVGDEQSVVVHADDNLIERVTTEVHDGTLRIASVGNLTTTLPMTVEIAIPSLERATLSGSGVLTVDGVNGSNFVARLLGAGVIEARGTIDHLDASVGGSGDAHLRNLLAKEVIATVSGTGRVEVHATESLDATVSGIGAIVYAGHPNRLTTHITGTGTITER